MQILHLSFFNLVTRVIRAPGPTEPPGPSMHCNWLEMPPHKKNHDYDYGGRNGGRNGGREEIVMHPAAMLKSLAQQADDGLSPSQRSSD